MFHMPCASISMFLFFVSCRMCLQFLVCGSRLQCYSCQCFVWIFSVACYCPHRYMSTTRRSAVSLSPKSSTTRTRPSRWPAGLVCIGGQAISMEMFVCTYYLIFVAFKMKLSPTPDNMRNRKLNVIGVRHIRRTRKKADTQTFP